MERSAEVHADIDMHAEVGEPSDSEDEELHLLYRIIYTVVSSCTRLYVRVPQPTPHTIGSPSASPSRIGIPYTVR